jgi:hypothetical protein
VKQNILMTANLEKESLNSEGKGKKIPTGYYNNFHSPDLKMKNG